MADKPRMQPPHLHPFGLPCEQRGRVRPTVLAIGLLATTGGRIWSVRSLLVNLYNEVVFRMDLREYLLPSLMLIPSSPCQPGPRPISLPL